MDMTRLYQAVSKRPVFIAALLVSVLFVYGCSTEDKSAKAPGSSEVTKSDVANIDQAKAHFDNAVELVRTSQLDAAIQEYFESLKLNPHSVEANSNLGFAYLDKWDFERAIEYQAKALNLNPEFANAYYGLALAYEKKGEKAEAVENWKEFIKRSPPGSRWALVAKEHLDDLE